jgi:hypothetical protein
MAAPGPTGDITMTNTQPAPTSTSEPTSAHATKASRTGWLSLILGLTAAFLICMGDPFWLALPVSLTAVTAAWLALRRSQQDPVVAHIGLSLALFDVLMWVLLVLFIGHILKADLSFLFEMPAATGQ